MRRRVLAVVASLPVVAVLVLGAEVLLAMRGPRLADRALRLDGVIGGPGPALDVVWLGDSTAAGVGSSSVDASLPRLVAAGLDRPVRLTVAAVSGDRVADVLRDQLAVVEGAELVLVSVGANDVTHLTRRGDFEERYRRVLAGLPAAAEVVLLGVPDMGSIPRLAQPLRAIAGFRGRQLSSSIRSVGQELDAAFVDIAVATGPAFRSDPGRYFADDEYHPSDAGYRLWAEAVLKSLERSGVLSAPAGGGS